MASIRKSIARDCRTVHCGALDFAKKIARLISDVNHHKWDIPNLDEEDMRDFRRNEGERVWQYLLAYGRTFAKNVKYSPRCWVMTEENFENCVHAMMQKTGYHKGKFGKEDLFRICAHILVIATWFFHNYIEIKMDTVIDVVYHMTLRMLNRTPIYASNWTVKRRKKHLPTPARFKRFILKQGTR
ncbi:hypothetical protein TNCT_308451 [Trichonephila clavata]|uniref:Uncharacterized protein n=1 Tax=Trichonephila clavata TaxID=2740835 RepID=A0A8X6L2H2_TRICU|nr:hypothetical protein TNCT_308451 [Trichonephila clavata]